MCRKFECREDIHYKTQTGTSCEKCNSKAFQLGIEPASSGLLDQCSTTELQKSLPTNHFPRPQQLLLHLGKHNRLLRIDGFSARFNDKAIRHVWHSISKMTISTSLWLESVIGEEEDLLTSVTTYFEATSLPPTKLPDIYFPTIFQNSQFWHRQYVYTAILLRRASWLWICKITKREMATLVFIMRTLGLIC